MANAGIEPKRRVGPGSAAARLLAPPPGLTGCVHIVIERDTRGLALSSSERLNLYPASPLPSLSWILEGELHMVDVDGRATDLPRTERLPSLVFAGPFRRPAASWSPGPVHALMVSFYPDALTRLWGVRLQDHVNRVVPAAGVLPPEAMTVLSRIGSAEAPLDALQSELAPAWQAVQPGTGSGDGGGGGIRNWLASLAARRHRSDLAIGLRQVQRRIKQLTGQSQRDLELYARIEAAVEHAARHDQDLATLAAHSGYSDQSHLGRELKRVTGLPARQLRERMMQEEAFWLYRLLDAMAAET